MDSLLHTIAQFDLRPVFPSHTPAALREVSMVRGPATARAPATNST